ncbi:MAG: hypothetical protein KDD69_05305 [Bdellovibrionales bacterium]|nr:hypothetical protein [Bdellovibrionales bacterium]
MLCTSCQEVQDETAEQETPVGDRFATPSVEAPPAEARQRKSTAELRQLYRATIGRTKAEDLLQIFSHPAVVAAAGILCWLVLGIAVHLALPQLGAAHSALISVMLLSTAAYLGLYCNILLSLFFVDRTAFYLCLGGLIGAPYIAFLYEDDIGVGKLVAASACFTLAVVTVIACYSTMEQVPPEVSDLFGFLFSGGGYDGHEWDYYE